MSKKPKPRNLGTATITAENMHEFAPIFTAEYLAAISRKIEADRAIRAVYPGFTADVEAELVRGNSGDWVYERQRPRRWAGMARNAAELKARNAAALPDGSPEQTAERWEAVKAWARACDMEFALDDADRDPWYIAMPYKLLVKSRWHLWGRWRNDA